jgi:hypothetical protein
MGYEWQILKMKGKDDEEGSQVHVICNSKQIQTGEAALLCEPHSHPKQGGHFAWASKVHPYCL